MAKNTFYFSHDYNSRLDEKIKLLIRKHGILGYGIFWAIVEDLYNNANALRTDYDGIAFDLRVDKNIVESILNDFDLFVFDNEFFGSLSVERRLNERNEKSVKARESALYRWKNKSDDANAMQTQCDGNAIKERKGNKSKGKEVKEIKEIYLSFDHLTLFLPEFNKLIEAGYTNNQIDSVLGRIQNYAKNKKYKSLYLTALDWLKKDNAQTTEQLPKVEKPKINPYL